MRIGVLGSGDVGRVLGCSWLGSENTVDSAACYTHNQARSPADVARVVKKLARTEGS
jgi:hypothetical protein